MSRKVMVCVRRAMLAALVMMFGALAASAQTVVDATTAEFQPSADHNAATPDGVPVVTSYLLQFFPGGTTSPSHSIDLGKPAPAPDGLIRFPFISRLTSPLVPGTTYQARVSAVGPGGTAASALSNPFTISAPCAPSISPASATAGAGGATGSVAVGGGASCAWTAASNASWITVTAGAAGTGPGSVSYAVAANASTSSRTGTLTIAGNVFTVTQTGATACSFTITPATRTSPAAGESTSVSVATTGSCAWTAVSSAAWITVNSGANGTGAGTVAMTVAANTAGSQRTGTVTIAGRSFTVTQQGVSCTYTVTPSTLTIATRGATSAVSVTTQAGCSWNATGAPSWMTVPTASQSGSGTVALTVGANTGPERTATLTIAGRPVVVTQSMAPPPPPPANFRVVSSGS